MKEMRLHVLPALLITGVWCGMASSSEPRTGMQTRRLLEFRQAILSTDAGWDYLLELAGELGSDSRHTVLTRAHQLPNAMLVDLVRNGNRSPRMRAIGLRYLPPKLLKREWAEEALRVENEGLQREVILSLQSSKAEWRDELLRETASDSQRPVSLRAEAVLGLSSHVDDPLNTHLLLRLIVSENRTLRIESLRALRGRATQNAGVLNALLRQIDNTAPAEEESDAQREFDEQLVLALAGIDDRDRPSLRTLRIRVQRQRPATLEAWQAKLRKGGDAAAGRRVFFHSKSAHCSRCHRADGRGGAIASDLTGAGRAASRRWLIESIVEPGRIIPGPYITWTLITETGKVHSGLVLAEDSDSIVLGTVDGRSTEIRTDAIVSRQPQRKSLMPDNLADQLTSEEFRDLLAFLCRD